MHTVQDKYFSAFDKITMQKRIQFKDKSIKIYFLKRHLKRPIIQCCLLSFRLDRVALTELKFCFATLSQDSFGKIFKLIYCEQEEIFSIKRLTRNVH